MSKKIVYHLIFILLFLACDDSQQSNDLSQVIESGFEDIKDPEKYLNSLSESFKIESVKKEDVNNDGFLDMEIIGLLGNGTYENFYFLNVEGRTYRMVGEEIYYSTNDFFEEDYIEYDKVEDFFKNADIDAVITILQTVYADINNDKIEDAIVVTHFYEEYDEVYEANDATIFYGNENGSFSYASFCELNILTNDGNNLKFLDIVTNGNYFSFEFENVNRKEIVTFKYDESYGNAILHKFGVISYDENKMPIDEKVLTVDDFGEILFEAYSSRKFSNNEDIIVSSTKELLNALGSNKVIYLEEGTYYLNHSENFSELSMENLNNNPSGNWVMFYETEFYSLYGTHYSDSSLGKDVEVIFKDLNNTKLIGKGDVKIMVSNEFLTVLSFESCLNVDMENIYLVHEVGGICSANVVDLNNCSNMHFTNVTFDGSGEVGISASKSEGIICNSCNFTNCTDGAIYSYDSKSLFQSCLISNNEVYQALIYADNYSYLVFSQCIFENNEGINNSEEMYLFFTEEESKIELKNNCIVKNNKNFTISNTSETMEIENIVFE